MQVGWSSGSITQVTLLALLAFRPMHGYRSGEPSRIALLEDPGPYLIPAGILAKVTYLTERRLGMSVLEGFVLDLEEGGLSLECGEEGLPPVRELVRRYADLALGFADASVIACADRVSGGRVLTIDRCPFGAVAREGRITLLPR